MASGEVKHYKPATDTEGDKDDKELQRFIDAVTQAADSKPDVTTKNEKDDVLIPPDGGWGWVVCAGAFVSNFIIDGLVYSSGFFPRKIRESFDEMGSPMGIATISWIFSLMSGFYNVGAPFVGIMTTKITFREVAIIGSLIAGSSFIIGAALLNWHLNIYVLYIMSIFGGIGISWMYVPSVIAVGFYFQRRRALATSICVSGSGVGSFALQPLVRYLVGTVGWRNTYYVEGGMLLLIIGIAMVYRPVRNQKIRVGKTSVPDGEEMLKKFSTAAKAISQLRMQSSVFPGSRIDDIVGAKSGENEKGDIFSVGSKEKRSPPDLPNILSAQGLNDKSTSKGSLGGLPDFSGQDLNNLVIAETDDFEMRIVETNPDVPEEPDVKSEGRANSTPQLERAQSSGVLYVGEEDAIRNPIYYEDIFLENYHGIKGVTTSDAEYEPEMQGKNYAVVVEAKKPLSGKGMPIGKIFQIKWITKENMLEKLFDCSLFANKKFRFVALTFFFLNVTLLIPYNQFSVLAAKYNYSNDDILPFFMTLGVANTVARVVSGILADLPWTSPPLMCSISLVVGAVGIVTMPFVTVMWKWCICAALIGWSVGFVVCLKSIILVEILGMEKLTNAFGLLCLVQGCGGLMGLPISGVLADYLQIENSFYFGTATLLTSAAMVASVHFIVVAERRQKLLAEGKTL